jgi:hypothetical protein
MLSLNFSSIQPYNRDEPLNTDFIDWTGSNFLTGQELCYTTDTLINEHLSRETEAVNRMM